MYDFITVSVWYQNPNYDHIYNVIQIKYDFIHVITVTIFACIEPHLFKCSVLLMHTLFKSCWSRTAFFCRLTQLRKLRHFQIMGHDNVKDVQLHMLPCSHNSAIVIIV